MPLRYQPPPLDRRIWIRDPALEPAVERDRSGRPLEPIPEWGVRVWAARRDQGSNVEIGEGVRVTAGRSVFTIRRRDVAANAVILDGGVYFDAVGPGAVRGGAAAGLRAEWLEITAQRRSA